jgi:hypothetical protein
VTISLPAVALAKAGAHQWLKQNLKRLFDPRGSAISAVKIAPVRPSPRTIFSLAKNL